MTSRALCVVLCAVLAAPAVAAAQSLESFGTRALGMGGAFVAVATDSSSSWWNPAAQAAGPFVDVSLGRATTEVSNGLPAGRDVTRWFTLSTLPVGFSYYHFTAVQAGVPPPTGGTSGSREEEQTEVPYRALAATQLGVTVAQAILPGVHVGSTLKYVRGTLRTATGAGSAADLLDCGEELTGGEAHGEFDLDVGLIAVGGPIRLGMVVRNVRAPEFVSNDAAAEPMRLPRQVRAGAAFDGEQAGLLPLIVSIDADLRSYASATGDRRVVALGAEQWLVGHRIGVRGGARFNTVGLEERAGTGGVSVALRSGLYVEGFVVRGGSRDERGWGASARVSF